MFHRTFQKHLTLLLPALSLCLGFCWHPASAETAQPASEVSSGTRAVISLPAAVITALQNSPELAAIDANATALKQIPYQVSALPDLMLSINTMNLPTDTFDFDQEPMTQFQVSLSQPLPYPGKRRLRKEIAELSVSRNDQSLREAQDKLTSHVRATWWQLFSTERALTIIETNKSLLLDFIEIARAKYAVGKGLQQDILLAELALSRLMERELMIQGARDRHEAQLNGLLNQPVITRVTTPQSPGNTALPSVQDLAQLTDQAMISRGILDDHRLQIASAQSRIELAEKDRYPDFSVGMGYAHRKGEDPLRGDRPDFVSVMFSMNLPLFTKQKQGKQLKQRHAEKQRSELLLDEAMRKVRSDIGQTAADYRAAKLQAELLNDTIIPQAEQTVASMLSGYQVNKVDFLNVVNGQLMLYNAQINYWQALGNAKAALARLAALAGKESLYE